MLRQATNDEQSRQREQRLDSRLRRSELKESDSPFDRAPSRGHKSGGAAVGHGVWQNRDFDKALCLRILRTIYTPESGRYTAQLPISKRSMLVRRKQSSASSGRQTTGSFSLNEVLRINGTEVIDPKAEISWW